MFREYTVWKTFNRNGSVISFAEKRKFDSLDNMKPFLAQETIEQYKDDPDFVRVQVVALPYKSIDFELMERMNAVREMCELGHKVRANTKIRNRQPLRYAYVAFSDRDIQDYMLYQDRKEEFADVIKDELNVMHVDFMDEATERRLFNYVLKPNFRVLGPKGYGKQAQALKGLIQCTPETAPKGTIPLTTEEKNELYTRLKKGDTVNLLGVPLTFGDVEIEFSVKEGFMSASNKVGALVLNTTLDEHLLELGFVADFRSVVQNARRDANLSITDKIFLEVMCEAKRANVIDRFAPSLKKDLLATGIDFSPPTSVDEKVAHRFFFHCGSLKSAVQVQELRDAATKAGKTFDESELDEELFYVKLFKELT